MENLFDKYSHINGWAIDADPENDPTYPMKNVTGDDHNRMAWERPHLQKREVEILKSIERPNLSAVFSNELPPKGISGQLRRHAFKCSESSYGHWLPLMLADRIDELEGIADDFKKGHIPNIFAERGGKAEWKYNRDGLIKKAVACALVTTAIIMLLKRK
jgi:hypothetical protein